MAFTLLSPDFARNGRLPVRFTMQGDSENPKLRWFDAPAGTIELALLCEDPDAPTSEPIVHWIVYGIPADVTEIPRALGVGTEPEAFDGKQGRNTFLYPGYMGPNPPFWHREHRYVFRLFALDRPLELAGGAGRGEFLEAIQGHVLAEATLVGRYGKSLSHRARAVGLWTSLATTAGLGGYVAFRRVRAARRAPRRPGSSDPIAAGSARP